jgi:hypothetical protein
MSVNIIKKNNRNGLTAPLTEAVPTSSLKQLVYIYRHTYCLCEDVGTTSVNGAVKPFLLFFFIIFTDILTV